MMVAMITFCVYILSHSYSHWICGHFSLLSSLVLVLCVMVSLMTAVSRGCTAWALLNIIFYGSASRVFNHKSKHWKSCLKQGVAEPWTLGFVIKLSFWLLWIGASGHLGLCHHECLYTTPTPTFSSPESAIDHWWIQGEHEFPCLDWVGRVGGGEPSFCYLFLGAPPLPGLRICCLAG